MTYEERKMCGGYANLINVADGIQHIYRLGADELLSVESRRKLSNAEAEEAITKYLQYPENRSRDIEVYQVRLDVTSSILYTN